VTNDPEFVLGAAASVGAGNFGLFTAQGMVNVPLDEKLTLRAAFSSQNRRGYLTNGSDDTRIDSQRVKMLLRPGGPITLLMAFDHTHEGGQGEGEIQIVPPPPGFPTGGDGIGSAVASANPWTSPDPGDAARHIEFWNARLELEWDLGFGLLTAIPAFRSGTNSCLNCWRSETDQNNFFTERQTTAEVRLASAPQSATTWLMGIYYLNSSDPSRTLQLGPGATSFDNSSGNLVSEQGQQSFHSRSYAAFGQATYHLTDRLRTTGGLRASVDRKDEAAYVSSERGGTILSTTGIFTAAHAWNSLTYTAGLEYDLSAATLAYARVASGYKAGGFYEGAPPNHYSPEHLRSYEVGAKSRILEDRLEIDADVFVYDYRDYQINYLGYINPTNAAIFGVLTANASGARVYGAEVAARYRPGRNDKIEISAYPLHTQFRTLIIDGPFGGIYTGLPLPFAPRLSMNLAYEHKARLESGATLAARISSHMEAHSWVTYNEARGTRQPGHSVVDFYAGFNAPGGAWSIDGYVKNLGNTVVLTNAQGGPAGLETADIGPPRTIGLQVCAHFLR
jgi:iron complex outermembrane receptor protein